MRVQPSKILFKTLRSWVLLSQRITNIGNLNLPERQCEIRNVVEQREELLQLLEGDSLPHRRLRQPALQVPEVVGLLLCKRQVGVKGCIDGSNSIKCDIYF